MIRFLPCLLVAPALVAAAPASQPRMLPERTLRCTLGRMTNFDPHREQKTSEITYEGKHPFTLVLPSIARREGPPPDAIDAPEPVDPRTRITGDPDGLTAKFPKRFNRVVDLWPQRVELATTIDDPLANVIVVSDFDPGAGTARMFMAQATDAATFDLDHLYGGECQVS